VELRIFVVTVQSVNAVVTSLFHDCDKQTGSDCTLLSLVCSWCGSPNRRIQYKIAVLLTYKVLLGAAGSDHHRDHHRDHPRPVDVTGRHTLRPTAKNRLSSDQLSVAEPFQLLLLPWADWAAWLPGTCQVGRLVRRPGGPPRQMLK